jgi:predicted acetyltransferase
LKQTASVTPTLELREVTAATRPVVERLWQLYRHDLSEFRGTLPEVDGTFPLRRLRQFLEGDANRRAYLFYRGASPVGLALVHGIATEPRSIYEFFVVRAVRREGVGRAAARELFALHPGTWEIAFQEANTEAARFWRGIAAATACDDWREEHRPVPGKPHIPPDVWLIFDAA